MVADKFLLKDHLFHRSKVERLASELQSVEPGFAREAFIAEAVDRFPELELKGRIHWMSACLRRHLGQDFGNALRTILRALPPPCDPSLTDDDFGDFIYAPYAHFVAEFGCRPELLDTSLEALRQITQRFSAEDAIRPFLKSYPSETLNRLRAWTLDPHYHVRRLCSEGTRPRLPWAQAIRLPLSDSLEILDRLYRDSTRYVTRSVANHLNDLSKEHPDAVLSTLTRWRQEGGQSASELDFIRNHSLRTLVKQGHQGCLALLGYELDLALEVGPLILETSTLRPGETLEFHFWLRSPKAARVVIDYQIEFQNKKGCMDSRKVFKLKALALPPNEKVVLRKSHPLRAQMTTRTLYPGAHRLSIQINGTRQLVEDFVLES